MSVILCIANKNKNKVKDLCLKKRNGLYFYKYSESILSKKYIKYLSEIKHDVIKQKTSMLNIKKDVIFD